MQEVTDGPDPGVLSRKSLWDKSSSRLLLKYDLNMSSGITMFLLLKCFMAYSGNLLPCFDTKLRSECSVTESRTALTESLFH